MFHPAWFMWCWRTNAELRACWINTHQLSYIPVLNFDISLLSDLFWFCFSLFFFCLFLMSLNLLYDLISYYSFMGKEPIDNGYTVKRRVRLNWFKQGLNSSTVARKPRKPVVAQSLRSWNTQNNRVNAPTTVRGYSLSLPFKSWSLVWCTCL